MFALKNVSRKFGDEFALQSISLEISSGMNFIIGPSGSGKTTLLKIISGMDKGYDGEVLYCDKDLKTYNENEKSKLYATSIGFISQNFTLIDNLTVTGNILLPVYLQKIPTVAVTQILKQLKIKELANQKVGTLSGGQKQRVVIARELLKNPNVLIADEPTAALDKKTAKDIMAILKSIAKEKIVIIVTHDTSLIDDKSTVFELDKGELINTRSSNIESNPSKQNKMKKVFSMANTFHFAKTNLNRNKGRTLVQMMCIVVSAVFLMLSTTGVLTNANDLIFEELYETYGTALLRMQISEKIMTPSSSNGQSSSAPNINIEQDISGLYEKYKNDSRIASALYTQDVLNAVITVDGQEHSIETSRMMPTFNKLLAGELPYGDGFEIMVSRKFVETMGMTNEEIIGKQMKMQCDVYNRKGQEVNLKPVNILLSICGVSDTSVTSYNGVSAGTIREYDDLFFFSENAIMEIMGQIEGNGHMPNFVMNANNVFDMVSVCDELAQRGIVPLGGISIVEDFANLNDISSQSTKSANKIVSILAIIVALSITVITAVLRKKECAIYKISGYENRDVFQMLSMEYIGEFFGSIILFTITLPLSNAIISKIFAMKLLSFSSFGISVLLILLVTLICFVASAMIASSAKAEDCLKSEDR